MIKDTETPRPAPPTGQRQRIAKLMARAGLCSRRDAEAWIVAGRVSLNGEILTSPAVDVSAEDTILVDDTPLPALDKTRLFLFHKPRGLVTSDRDPEGRATVADFLREHWPDGPRVVTVGRLDINTEGLLLLTNDGGLARTLELPQTGWVRRYRVRAKGTADPAALDALAAGITIDGIEYAGIEAKLDRVQGANVWLTMGLREGKNREIKRVLEHLGLEVNRLIRLSFGPFQLLDLPEGAVEQVRTRVLRDQLGAKLAAQAGVAFDEPPPQAATPPAKPVAAKPVAAKSVREARPARAERGTRSERPRPGGRGAGPRRKAEAEAPPPRRERPTRGTRKHVSTLRAERSESERTSPRTRIERTATSDRRQRSVVVERVVRPEPPSPPRHRREPDANATEGRRMGERAVRGQRRDDDAAREHRRPAPSRGRTGGARTDTETRHRSDDSKRSSGRRHTSPSAAGKRERVARSGPRRDERATRDRATHDRGDRGDRGDAAAARRINRPKPKGRVRSDAATTSGDRKGPRGSRPPGRRPAGEQERGSSRGPARPPGRGDRPPRKTPSGDRPRGPSKKPRR